MSEIRIIIMVFCVLFLARFLIWLVSWYEYRHPRVAEITEEDIKTLEAEYKKLVRDHQYREKRRSMEP